MMEFDIKIYRSSLKYNMVRTIKWQTCYTFTNMREENTACSSQSGDV